MHVQDENLQCNLLQRDRDAKYTLEFDEVFKSAGCTVKVTPPLSPNLQAYVERSIQTLKHEVLNGFCIISDTHLNHILQTSQDWYNFRRGHSARNNLPPVRNEEVPPTIDLRQITLVCHKELGGHLKSYRAAA